MTCFFAVFFKDKKSISLGAARCFSAPRFYRLKDLKDVGRINACISVEKIAKYYKFPANYYKFPANYYKFPANYYKFPATYYVYLLTRNILFCIFNITYFNT
jgi:hypothetical protein